MLHSPDGLRICITTLNNENLNPKIIIGRLLRRKVVLKNEIMVVDTIVTPPIVTRTMIVQFVLTIIRILVLSLMTGKRFCVITVKKQVTPWRSVINIWEYAVNAKRKVTLGPIVDLGSLLPLPRLLEK